MGSHSGNSSVRFIYSFYKYSIRYNYSLRLLLWLLIFCFGIQHFFSWMNFSVKRREKPNTPSQLRQQLCYFAQIFIQTNKKKAFGVCETGKKTNKQTCTTKRDEVKYVRRGGKNAAARVGVVVCAGEIMSRGHRGTEAPRQQEQREDLSLAAAHR